MTFNPPPPCVCHWRRLWVPTQTSPGYGYHFGGEACPTLTVLAESTRGKLLSPPVGHFGLMSDSSGDWVLPGSFGQWVSPDPDDVFLAGRFVRYGLSANRVSAVTAIRWSPHYGSGGHEGPWGVAGTHRRTCRTQGRRRFNAVKVRRISSYIIIIYKWYIMR